MLVMWARAFTPSGGARRVPQSAQPEGAPIGHCTTLQGSRPSTMNMEPSCTCTDQGSSSPSSPSTGRSATTTPPVIEQPKSAHQCGKAWRNLGKRAAPGISGGPSAWPAGLWHFSAMAARREIRTPGRPLSPSLLRRKCNELADKSGKRTICSNAAVASSRAGAARCHCVTAAKTSSSLSTEMSSLPNKPIMRCKGQAPNCSVLAMAEKC
mmetsp:Transcript_78329/g.239576  ORF Transcript_78329/g.239576 Transcript_78329/m.239576 type:complete len:210 (-) Transcript_78329:515-1144(-)